jgi:mono/diheme cytochrome c family protein
MIATLGILVVLIGILVFEGMGSSWSVPTAAKMRANPVPATDLSLAAGQAIYRDRCSSCHGDNGDGKGRQAHLYSVKPSNFTEANRMDAQTDGELFWKITVGNKPMPKFQKMLTEEQRWEVVDFIRTFSHPRH